MTDANASNIIYAGQGSPIGPVLTAINGVAKFTPPADHPFVAVQPHAGSALGNWSNRLQTSPSGTPLPTPTSTSTPKPTATPPPTPTPAPTGTPQPPGTMIVGLNGGGWGPSEPADEKPAVNTVRLDTPGDVSEWTNAGMSVIADFSGPYSGGGVASINATNWANNVANWYATDCHSTTTTCKAIEVLNEPDGSWFWGSNAKDQTNATAYANLLKTVHNTFVSRFGSNHPLILANWDYTWGSEVWGSDPNVNSYIDGVIVHPYGGHSCTSYPTNCSSAHGNVQQVSDAHAATGMPVYLTEVGWPTDCSGSCPSSANETGDSLQWSQRQQADNIYNFINWARSTGYVKAVIIFGSHDYGTNNYYGVEGPSSLGSYKPSFYALGEAAKGQACTVC
jgi:hypothetical protein